MHIYDLTSRGSGYIYSLLPCTISEIYKNLATKTIQGEAVDNNSYVGVASDLLVSSTEPGVWSISCLVHTATIYNINGEKQSL